jgi:hypothetical protein
MEIFQMTKLIAAAAGLAVAGTAFAQVPFTLDSMLVGTTGGSTESSPIVPAAGGDFYQEAAFGANFAQNINPLLFPSFPNVELDSYISIADGPVTSAGDGGLEGNVAGADGFGPFDSPADPGVNGSFFLPGGVLETSIGGDSDFDIFLGRYTTLDGPGLEGGIKSGNIRVDDNNDGVLDFNDSIDATLVDLVIGGPFVSAGVQSYRLVTETSEVTLSTGATVWVNDLYIEAIPTPGAAGLLGLAGLAAIRRRR